MGSIISSRVQANGTMLLEISADIEEVVRLNGNIKNIHLIAEKTSMIKSNLSQRGKNEATKYFLVPRELRKDLHFKRHVSCQRLDCNDKTMFVYVVSKHKQKDIKKKVTPSNT